MVLLSVDSIRLLFSWYNDGDLDSSRRCRLFGGGILFYKKIYKFLKTLHYLVCLNNFGCVLFNQHNEESKKKHVSHHTTVKSAGFTQAGIKNDRDNKARLVGIKLTLNPLLFMKFHWIWCSHYVTREIFSWLLRNCICYVLKLVQK